MKNELYYPAVFTPDGQYYCVEFPDLEGCLTQGEDIEEAYHAAREALALYLDTIGTYPKPSAIKDIKLNEGQYVMLIEPHTDYPIEDANGVDITKILSEALAKKGFSKYRVAKILGISESYVNLICQGKRSPSTGVAQQMGALLDLDWRLFYV
nr:MAG TPA: HicB-like toxin [Caudoviricetes sp.]